MKVRHPNNKNLMLLTGDEWNGLSLLPNTTYIEGYLERILKVIHRAVQQHGRLFAIRFDLTFPNINCLGDINDHASLANSYRTDSTVISRFFESLKAKINADLERKRRRGQRVHPTGMHYLWVKEQASSSNPHYHVVLLLNKDTYYSLGNFSSLSQEGESLATIIRSSWASGISADYELAAPCVHFCHNGTFHVNINGDDICFAINSLFQRVSYLAKSTTKHYNDGGRWFGSSRT